MNKFLKHPEPTDSDLKGPNYWRSLDELSESPGFKEYLHREFPEGAAESDGVNRRNFLKIMSASFAFGGFGLAGCRRPEHHVLPYSKQPEEIIHGKPLYYASAMPFRNDAVPVIVESHNGRPTKIEGNDLLENRNGGTNQFAQAAILDLYDPDRSRSTVLKNRTLSEAQRVDHLAGISKKYSANKGEGLVFLAEGIPSLTRKSQVKRLKKKFPKAIWAEYDAIDTANPEKAAKAVFGKSVRAIYHFEKATRVLSLEADFLYSDPNSLAYTAAFSKARKVEGTHQEMNRLYAAESYYSITGGMADHRMRIGSSQIPALTALFAAEVFAATHTNNDLVPGLRAKAEGLHIDENWVKECAKDLVHEAGHSLVVAGPHQPVEVQTLIIAMNEALGATGKTLEYISVSDNGAASISDVADSINADKVSTLVVLEGNPVYNAPSDLKWSELQAKVSEVVRLGYNFDETSEVSDLHINSNHYLESWGDAISYDGTILAMQPMILPLFQGLSESEVLEILISGAAKEAYSIVYDAVTAGAKISAKAFEKFLHDGFLSDGQYAKASVSIIASAVAAAAGSAALAATKPSASNLELRFIADPSVDDGRYANNGWMQECPDPVTKLTWDNAFLVSPNLAKELDIQSPDPMVTVVHRNPNAHSSGRQTAPVITINVNGKEITGPAHIQPGLPDYTVVVPLGYGRKVVGRIGDEAGFDAYPLRTTSGLSSVVGATVTSTGEYNQLGDTQEHWSMEGRAIIREANKDFFDKNPNFVDQMGMESHSPHVLGTDEHGVNRRDSVPLQELVVAGDKNRGQSAYVTPEFTGDHQWGMSIDLNTCTGCNACVIACQSENNIPIVGKDQVLRGREMHWIRLDRYYSAGPELERGEVPVNPQVSLQPMTCQHCETAPCESVCPVNATVHDDEGLNVMAYNRCVGTRYCANNCPYKVRRFNFLDWNDRDIEQLYKGPLGPKGMDELTQMSKNPDVTVRMRGVMEKCTFCLQRIQAAKIDKIVEARDSDDIKVPDGTIKVACQQVCPADSIVFGDVSDPDSRVSKLKTLDRDYGVLAYLNTRPRTTYLAKIRNPNAMMPDYYDNPLSHLEYNKESGHVEHHGEAQGDEHDAHATTTEDNGHGGH